MLKEPAAVDGKSEEQTVLVSSCGQKKGYKLVCVDV